MGENVLSNLDALKAFEVKLKSEDGVTIDCLELWLTKFYAGDRSRPDIDDYRETKRPWKKLRDEVSPVSKFLASRELKGRVRFPLDSHVPDCWYDHGTGFTQGIEVISSLGRAGYQQNRQLTEEGSSGGVIGFLQNSSNKAEFDEIRRRGRTMFSSIHG